MAENEQPGTVETQVQKALQDFKLAYEYKKGLIKAQDKDHLFALGKQWDAEDVQTLKNRGVEALTINKIRPNLLLLTGIESQNRSDFRAYPEGKEDSLVAEIATGLMKNVMKNSLGHYKISMVFDDGATCGESYIEPWIDKENDIMYGELKFKKQSYKYVFLDPASSEYDFSDARFVCKLKLDLTKDELLQMFPKAKSKIEKIENGRLNIDQIGEEIRTTIGSTIQKKGYDDGTGPTGDDIKRPTFDLLEYEYRKYNPVYYIADFDKGVITRADDKDEAQKYVDLATAAVEASKAAPVEGQPPLKGAELIEHYESEVWVCSIVGSLELESKRLASWPRWKGYSVIPFFAYWSTTPLDRANHEYSRQGVVRGMVSLQKELNKRRTQELHLLNTSANSGWLVVKESWVDPDAVENYGSSAGVTLEWDYEKAHGIAPQKITPTPLSQGHAQLAEEKSQDIKESSGINTDLLAIQEGGQSSGRAISLRQKQGLVMVQKLFDNLSLTKQLLGRYILAVLPDLFDVQRAIEVMGEAFIKENFSVPVLGPQVDPVSGQPMMGPDGRPVMGPQIGQDGQLVTEVDKKMVAETFNRVLNDIGLGKFHVAIGETINTETQQLANYLTLTDMAQKGIPVPPDVLVEESGLSSSSKEKIKAAIEKMQSAPQVPPKGR